MYCGYSQEEPAQPEKPKEEPKFLSDKEKLERVRRDLQDADIFTFSKTTAAFLLRLVDKLQVNKKITFVPYSYGVAFYQGENLFLDSSSSPGWEKVLAGMGFEVTNIRVEAKDMPDRNPSGGHAPKTLTELQDHLKNLVSKRREERIAALKEELAKLEQGEKA